MDNPRSSFFYFDKYFAWYHKELLYEIRGLLFRGGIICYGYVSGNRLRQTMGMFQNQIDAGVYYAVPTKDVVEWFENGNYEKQWRTMMDLHEATNYFLEEMSNFPKVFYHTTPAENLKSIKKYGLRYDKATSSSQGVYLSDNEEASKNYAYMYQDDDFITITIKSNMLDKTKLGPDDYEFPDLLSQMNPEEAESYDENSWEDSLDVCNQVIYFGNITPDMFLKIEKWEK